MSLKNSGRIEAKNSMKRLKLSKTLSKDRHLRVVAPELFIRPDFLFLNLHD
ncbi:hypothetical protein LEP1GSC034_2109 [Leptospira interrogans str. 2003000735]|uniref:Uncharacterized protein n=3 Tax=Leptospira interrogans TaxID=173 RepID=M7A135_LEPIR|nr:hypothetical protein LEP1GSC027_1858 [Leptospira interrogans str. 2002000624]EKO04974.1 hypothetical protein LEP1GSC077_1083 [Leptospira interrogans str. C10069]EKQ46720.1 hypothetical protein LEP1GSC026_3338 [Leptospira interrogans str. 2002000623]EMF73707.1 hypothetical protein LEP1GSC148_1321 [Leptospira interrogans serovar Canicola str. LT1962]EMJ75263.1 hypothetical protein LEP1GSC033_4293 [Leptospira interrogans str. 2002000632]EMJ75787.1 hypothetical protein LEP1GSC034_2109 [Leptospi